MNSNDKILDVKIALPLSRKFVRPAPNKENAMLGGIRPKNAVAK